MDVTLNKFANIGTLEHEQVDENWTEIEAAFGEINSAGPSNALMEASPFNFDLVAVETVAVAMVWQQLTDAASITVDFETFSQALVILEGNRTLANPTNVNNMTRYVLVQGTDSTPRTLSFGSAYKGDLPVLTDITDSRWYLLTLVPLISSHIIVSAVRAL